MNSQVIVLLVVGVVGLVGMPIWDLLESYIQGNDLD